MGNFMKATKNWASSESLASTERKDVYQVITDKIIKMIEEGVNPWKKTWKNVDNDFSGPQNYISGRPYTGINFFVLSCSPYSFPYFMTMKQVNEKGGQVKKGESATPVVFARTFDKKEMKQNDSGNSVEVVKKGFCYKLYYVFNIEQTTLPLPEVNTQEEENNATIEKCEGVLLGYKNAPKLVHDSNSAFYNPLQDIVNMPKIGYFVSSQAYYATLFHELIHSTGAENRLNREGIVDFDTFGSENYSNEELVAEMGAAYLNALTGITNPDLEENTAAYLIGWLKPLKNDKRFVFKAAAAAQRGVGFIIGNEQDSNAE
jgi:antirestriction protein ArdC